MTEPRDARPDAHEALEPTVEPMAPELDALVGRMRSDVPTDAELAALGARVLAAVTSAPTAPGPASTETAPQASTTGAAGGAAGASSTGAIVASVIAAIVATGGAIGAWRLTTLPPGAAPLATSEREHDDHDAGTATDAPVASSSAAVDVTREHVLLERARRVASSDPASALALAEEHARVAPDGVLAPEREVVAIEALRALGRHEEASQRLAAFIARHPGSPYLERLGSSRR